MANAVQAKEVAGGLSATFRRAAAAEEARAGEGMDQGAGQVTPDVGTVAAAVAQAAAAVARVVVAVAQAAGEEAVPGVRRDSPHNWHNGRRRARRQPQSCSG